MTPATHASGSAHRWGPLWGARARDWAANEELQRPVYEEGFRRLALEPGQSVLDVGCGSGVFLRLAADRGARPSGIDASAELIEIARERVPEADLRVGDMEALPFGDGAVDAVTGFYSFFFADDMVAALREAGRVAAPGAPVLIAVWGRPERNELEPVKAVIRPYLPPRPADAPAQPELWRPGVLEAIAREAGLAPESAFDFTYAFEVPDAETLARLMMAPAGLAQIVGPEREPAVARAIVDALAPRRTANGAYRIASELRVLLARA